MNNPKNNSTLHSWFAVMSPKMLEFSFFRAFRGQKLLSRTQVTLIVTLLILHTSEALAWQQITCILPSNHGKKKHWTVKAYKPVIDSVSIPAGSPQYAAVLAALNTMNLNPSQFRYQLGGIDTNGVAVNNGESEIWMKDLGENYAGVSAIEQSDADYSPTCTATESDIIINTRYRPSRAPVGISKIGFTPNKPELFEYGGSYASLHSIVMHELGHSAGLQHEGNVLNLMGGDNLLITNGDMVQPYIGEDAATGLIALHGLSPVAQEDISVSHWRYGEKIAGGGGSFFSVHHRTRIFDAHNVELPKQCAYQKPDINGALITACPEPIYRVTRGQKINLEFSYENAGKTRSLPVQATYYLSADNTIDTRDTLLKTRSITLKQDGKPSTLTTELLIPDTVAKGGTYWLGCMVDANNTLKESIESNNATYIGIIVE